MLRPQTQPRPLNNLFSLYKDYLLRHAVTTAGRQSIQRGGGPASRCGGSLKLDWGASSQCIKKWPRLRGLKGQTFISSHFWRLEGQVSCSGLFPRLVGGPTGALCSRDLFCVCVWADRAKPVVCPLVNAPRPSWGPPPCGWNDRRPFPFFTPSVRGSLILAVVGRVILRDVCGGLAGQGKSDK